ncbi:thiamine phosphate synthase [Terasakiella sp. A23]|uniref:thiamine phosphate synthase n=1 Tax=Terasakiella sp. FCG-A23 TaxID=3080561 RepID=UPI002953CA21|nr:thiamine phosphate synthase [Terasakiella sp. A23]MDV7339861.1 thiamine phosphate synthase [Terasakiella sp. A23]
MSRNLSELALRLNRLNAPDANFPPLFLMTDAKRLPDPSDFIPLLPKGSAVIVRHFSEQEKTNIIFKIKPVCRKHKIKILVSDSPSLALRHQLDGVHFPEKTVRKIAGCGYLRRARPSLIFTAACHSARALNAAQKARLDAVLISPIFATQSHPGGKTLGPWTFQKLSRTKGLKTYGLGGINPKTAQRLITSRACGFAGIGSLLT